MTLLGRRIASGTRLSFESIRSFIHHEPHLLPHHATITLFSLTIDYHICLDPMVRLKELRDKISVNQTFRNWQASHTFGGTTKARSLYIAGFRRKNFYYVAAAAGVALLIGSIAGGVSFRRSVNTAENRGQAEAAVGQLIPTRVTESRTRTLISDGIVVVTTEISSFETTIQRGAGTTIIQTIRANGETMTIPGSITFVTNSNDMMVGKTLLGSTFFITQTDGVTVPTTLYGDPTTFTNTNGDDITSTLFSELTVVTEVDGDVSTSLRSRSSSMAIPLTSGQIVPSTQTDKATTTGTSGNTSTGTSITSQTRTTSSSVTPSSASNSSTSRSSASTSTTTASSPKSTFLTSSAGGGGGGTQFKGEGTFYTPGLGSCGTDSTEADFVAALSKVLFDATGVANSNNNPYCGRRALVKGTGAKRLSKREQIVDVDVTQRVWYSGNVTLDGWKNSRSMKESRRSKIISGTEPGQKNLPENFSYLRPSTDYISIPVATPEAARPNLDLIPSQPIVTPPPKASNMDLEKRQAGGGGVTITIVDRCPVCAQYDLDLSPAAFDVIGSQGDGRIAIEWSWLD